MIRRDQLTLFERDLGLGPELLPHNGTDTSQEAAESMREHAGAIRERVFKFIAQRGPDGATCDEVEVGLCLRHQTASARVNELHRDQRIVDSGEKRPTRSGRSAKVWTARKGARHAT